MKQVTRARGVALKKAYDLIIDHTPEAVLPEADLDVVIGFLDQVKAISQPRSVRSFLALHCQDLDEVDLLEHKAITYASKWLHDFRKISIFKLDTLSVEEAGFLQQRMASPGMGSQWSALVEGPDQTKYSFEETFMESVKSRFFSEEVASKVRSTLAAGSGLEPMAKQILDAFPPEFAEGKMPPVEVKLPDLVACEAAARSAGDIKLAEQIAFCKVAADSTNDCLAMRGALLNGVDVPALTDAVVHAFCRGRSAVGVVAEFVERPGFAEIMSKPSEGSGLFHVATLDDRLSPALIHAVHKHLGDDVVDWLSAWHDECTRLKEKIVEASLDGWTVVMGTCFS